MVMEKSNKEEDGLKHRLAEISAPHSPDVRHGCNVASLSLIYGLSNGWLGVPLPGCHRTRCADPGGAAQRGPGQVLWCQLLLERDSHRVHLLSPRPVSSPALYVYFSTNYNLWRRDRDE